MNTNINAQQDNNQRNKKKKKRANLIIATQNIKGRTSLSLGPSQISKWTAINHLMRDKKIGILCAQETHLLPEHTQQIDNLFSRWLRVLNSSDPDRPGNSAGVAFIINKELMDDTNCNMLELIPGRAIALTINWHNNEPITIINIYAPNNMQEHPNFWKTIQEKWREQSMNEPDFMMGDFNLTEDQIDRAPARTENDNATNALRDLRQTLNVQDTWRHTYPNTRLFTFASNVNTLSRLDRIYAHPKHDDSLIDWQTGPTNIPTDHSMVQVRFAPPNTPHIGQGRWTWPLGLLTEKTLMNKIITTGIELQEKLTEQNNATNTEENPQRLWENFKNTISDETKKTAKSHLAKINHRIKQLQDDIQRTCNLDTLDTDEHARIQKIMLEHEIQHLEQKRYKNAHIKAQATWNIKGETKSKYWSKINSPKKPRDIIPRLRTPGTNHLVTRSDKMAELAKEYHDSIQQIGLTYNATEHQQRQTTQKEILSEIPEEQKIHAPNHPLNDLLTEQEILNALMTSKSGSAAGIDGIPYEIWKTLHEIHKRTQQENRTSFDIIKTLTIIINDIQINGIRDDTNFTLGWMCPLYKKKDRLDIANYRPITLLNTDYKILTKALAINIAKEAQKLIHPNQSGFIPNRTIFDPIRLVQTMTAYADVMEEDGVIIALDQEKAYDHITHDYLFETLKAFNIPNACINTIKSLYKNAHTKVIINGVISSPFKVTRGVRQGDPLSCLLFDLAIEPLACALRNSTKLSGYNIPGVANKTIVNMYADDTTIFLRKHDKYTDFEQLLTKWCFASGAKFNLEKTEILPIRSKEYRNTIRTNHKLHEQDTRWDKTIRIAQDGHPIRILGAWIGNEIDNAHPWEPILDKIENNLKRWNLSHPTLRGKKLIIQMIAGGMTQFLTKAQGMPSNIENALVKTIRKFMWNNAHTPPMSLERLYLDKTQGGLNLLDIKTRNQAINITWLKEYLDLTPTRPTWAFATDAIINTLKPEGIRNDTDVTSFLTTWDPPSAGPRARKLPNEIINLIKTAKTHQVSFAPLKLAKNIKNQLPAWWHIGAAPRTYHKAKNECLKNIHAATKIKDLIETSKRLNETNNNETHHQRNNCTCTACRNDRRKGCKNPHKCATIALTIIQKISPKFNPTMTPQKDNLTLTHRRKEKNQRALTNNQDEIIFDPSITTKNSLTECFRIFVKKEKISQTPALRLQLPPNHRRPTIAPIEVFTDGSCSNNGKENAKCGSGIWFSPDDPRNKAIRPPGKQSNQTGEIAAILIGLQETDPLTPITFISDSKYAINGITKHLKDWEDRGWINVANKNLFKATAYHLRRRPAQTAFKWIKGHSGIQGNEEVDHLASMGAQKTNTDIIDTEIPNDFDLQGAKLSTMTQALAYKGIREQISTELKRQTIANLDLIRYALENITNNLETDQTIWQSCTSKDIQKKIQIFIYKTLHNTHRIGSFWSNIPNYEQRERCPSCTDETESIEHILTECREHTNSTIWSLARQTWPAAFGPWPNITIGLILGSGTISILHNDNRGEDQNDDQTQHNALKAKGASRLLRILISESAYLIWTLRCERVIQERTHTIQNITKRWLHTINNRLHLDRITASKIKRNKKTETLVKHTWKDCIYSDSPIPNNWATALEVLVGIKLPRTPQPEDPR